MVDVSDGYCLVGTTAEKEEHSVHAGIVREEIVGSFDILERIDVDEPVSGFDTLD